MNQTVTYKKTPIISKEELKKPLIEEWKLIPTDYTQKIILNMPKRLAYVIKQKGNPTKY